MVDKPKKGQTITIKLNGEDKKFREEPNDHKPKPMSKPASKVVKIKTDLTDNEVMKETAAAKDPIDDSFDWIIPESTDHDIEEFKMTSYQSPKKNIKKNSKISFLTFSKTKNRKTIGAVFISAFFAILIGTTIGFLMLKLVIIDSDEQSNHQPQSTIVEKETGGNENEPVKDVSASIPELSTYIIQGGVFSSKEGAEETAKDIKSKGIPYSIVEMDGKHYLLLGVGDSLETAKVIVSKYKKDGVEDAFAKSLLIDKKNVSGMNETEQSFIESVPTIYQTIATATTSGFSSNTISEKAFKEMTSKEEQLKKSSMENEKIKKIQSELLRANEKVNAFHKSKDTKNLKEAEQHLLNFLSVYYSL